MWKTLSQESKMEMKSIHSHMMTVDKELPRRQSILWSTERKSFTSKIVVSHLSAVGLNVDVPNILFFNTYFVISSTAL